jgi:hypothetical protein
MAYDQHTCETEIFTATHRYSGQLCTRGYRLSDFLNDATTEVLDLRDVTLCCSGEPAAEAVQCPSLYVKKDAVLIACPRGVHEAPVRRFFSYVAKSRYFAQIVLPGYTAAGFLHLQTRANPWILMLPTSTEATYLPLTDVSLSFSNRGAPVLHTRVAIFRRTALESLFLADRPAPPPEPEPTSQTSGLAGLARLMTVGR